MNEIVATASTSRWLDKTWLSGASSGPWKSALALLLAILLPLTAIAAPVDLSTVKVDDYVVIKKRGGGTVEGIVLKITAESIEIKGKFGKFPVRKDDIESCEVRKSNADLYKEKSAQCKSADDWFELGQWAKSVNEPDLADQSYRKAVELDKDHAEAREALGEVEFEGEWMPKDDAMRAQGKELYKGEWLTPEEIKERQEREKDKLREEKRAGQDELQLEYIGRPWGEIEPIVTENYRIYCNSTEEVAREYARIMEMLHEKYSKVFGRLPRYRSGKGKVFIHANHQQFMDWTGSPAGVGGFYKPWNTDVTAYHGSFGMTGSTYEVLAHEGTHQFEGFILKDFRACPMWIIEGLAVFFGDGSELKRTEVEVGVIPQDRLVGLKRFISQDQAWRLDHFCLQGQPYPGAFYASAWGVIYWCLWGSRMKGPLKAHNGEGVKVIEDYLLHVTTAEGPCDYRAELKKFKGLITQHTKYSTVEAWEEDYKEWILALPVSELGKKKGNRWVSEKLAMEVAKPSGWRWVKAEDRTSRAEVVAIEKSGKQRRRISSYCWPNWSKAELSTAAVKQALGGIVELGDRENEYEDREDSDDGLILTEVHGYEVAETRLTGYAVQATNSSVGTDQAAASDTGPRVRRQFRVVFYVAFDRIYANVLEADPEVFADQETSFDRYLKEFKYN